MYFADTQLPWQHVYIEQIFGGGQRIPFTQFMECLQLSEIQTKLLDITDVSGQLVHSVRALALSGTENWRIFPVQQSKHFIQTYCHDLTYASPG